MSRSDDERIADIVEAAAEIAAVVDGKTALDADRVSRLAVNVCWRSSWSQRER